VRHKNAVSCVSSRPVSKA